MTLYVSDWNIEEVTGYKPKTTFYLDLSLAELDGERGIRDTYKRCFNDFKNDVKYFTEFVMALNWKIWEHYNKNQALAKLYDELWGKADNYALKHFKGEDLSYFLRTVD